MRRMLESSSRTAKERFAGARVASGHADGAGGPELDAQVARAVFGATICRDGRLLTCSGEPVELCLAPVEPERYSTDLAAARWVVDRLIALGWDVLVECHRTWLGRERWRVAVGDTVEEARDVAPAICRAALRALSTGSG